MSFKFQNLHMPSNLFELQEEIVIGAFLTKLTQFEKIGSRGEI